MCSQLALSKPTAASEMGESGRAVRKRTPILVRCVACLLLLLVCFHIVVPAQAIMDIKTVHIQASIDLATWEILTGVVQDESGITQVTPEWRRMTEDDLNALAGSTGSFSQTVGNLSLLDDDTAYLTEGSDDYCSKEKAHGFNWPGMETNRVLTFPTNQTGRDSSTSADMENALRVNSAITFDLNQAFNIYCVRNNITKTANAMDMLTNLRSFLGSVTGGTGDYITYYSSTNPTDTSTTQYRWRVNKGSGSDAYAGEYVTWGMLIVEAFNNFCLEEDEAITSENVYASSSPNQLSQAVTSLFSSMLDGLRSILGLWTMDELIYNDGWRGGGYVGGIFPQSWESTIWALFIFTEIIAAMMLLFGIINNVLKQAASTVNTIARMQAMTQIQNLLICAIALTILPLALRMLISLSSNLVEIIQGMAPINAATGEQKTISDLVKRFMSGSGTIGGVIAQFLYFGIQVYFNFFYALRALTVAILIIMAPLMISMISVSSSRTQITMTWMKELLSNILVQPIHAFCITVILLFPTSSHGFDNLVALYALIPFTSMIRSLFFGPSGNWQDQVSNRGKMAVNGALNRAANNVGTTAAGAIVNRIRSGRGGGEDGESGDSAAPASNTAGNDLTQKDSTGTSDTRVGAGTDGGTGQPMTLGDRIKAVGSNFTDRLSGAKDSAQEKFNNIKEKASDAVHHPARTAKNAAKAVGRTAATVGRVGVGLGLSAAGGAISGATRTNAGYPLEYIGETIIGGHGTNKDGKFGKPDKKQENTARQPEKPSLEQGQQSSDTHAAGSEQSSAPVTLGNFGKQKADTFDDKAKKEMKVRDANQKDLDKEGIGNLEDSYKTMEFSVNADSQQGKELGAYADYLQSLPPKERKAEVDKRGIQATRTGDNEVAVRIDKDRWSKANNGARIQAKTDKNGDPAGMRIKTPVGAKDPSFAGTKDNARKVDTASIPEATVQQKTPTTTKNGEQVTQPDGLKQQLMDRGLTEKQAQKAADRVGMTNAFKEQGYSDAEASAKAKKELSGAQAGHEVFVPETALSEEQKKAMDNEAKKGAVKKDANGYHMDYAPGKPLPVVNKNGVDNDDDVHMSFQRHMDEQSKKAAEHSESPGQQDASPQGAPNNEKLDESTRRTTDKENTPNTSSADGRTKGTAPEKKDPSNTKPESDVFIPDAAPNAPNTAPHAAPNAAPDSGRGKITEPGVKSGTSGEANKHGTGTKSEPRQVSSNANEHDDNHTDELTRRTTDKEGTPNAPGVYGRAKGTTPEKKDPSNAKPESDVFIPDAAPNTAPDTVSNTAANTVPGTKQGQSTDPGMKNGASRQNAGEHGAEFTPGQTGSITDERDGSHADAMNTINTRPAAERNGHGTVRHFAGDSHKEPPTSINRNIAGGTNTSPTNPAKENMEDSTSVFTPNATHQNATPNETPSAARNTTPNMVSAAPSTSPSTPPTHSTPAPAESTVQPTAPTQNVNPALQSRVTAYKKAKAEGMDQREAYRATMGGETGSPVSSTPASGSSYRPAQAQPQREGSPTISTSREMPMVDNGSPVSMGVAPSRSTQTTEQWQRNIPQQPQRQQPGNASQPTSRPQTGRSQTSVTPDTPVSPQPTVQYRQPTQPSPDVSPNIEYEGTTVTQGHPESRPVNNRAYREPERRGSRTAGYTGGGGNNDAVIRDPFSPDIDQYSDSVGSLNDSMDADSDAIWQAFLDKNDINE